MTKAQLRKRLWRAITTFPAPSTEQRARIYATIQDGRHSHRPRAGLPLGPQTVRPGIPSGIPELDAMKEIPA